MLKLDFEGVVTIGDQFVFDPQLVYLLRHQRRDLVMVVWERELLRSVEVQAPTTQR
jgi:hypothetical protein